METYQPRDRCVILAEEEDRRRGGGLREGEIRGIPPLGLIEWSDTLPNPLHVDILIQSGLEGKECDLAQGMISAFSKNKQFAFVLYRTPNGEANSRPFSIAFLKEVNPLLEIPTGPQANGVNAQIAGAGQPLPWWLLHMMGRK